MHLLAPPAALIGRILISLIFILAGAAKLGDIAGTDAYIQSVGLPAGLALPAALFELIGGVCILLGFLVRPMALLLSGFCIVTALFFHNDFANQMQMTMFLKNIALAGGFLILFAYGNMAYSFDSLRNRRKTEKADAQSRIEAAEAQAKAASQEASAS
ncbi:MAG: DoxX family protein [Blastomonas sp.]